MGSYAVAVAVSLMLSLSLSFVLALRTLSPDTISSAAACHPSKEPQSYTLRSDQFTVLINGYSESRFPLLQSITATYSASPLVSSVLVLWGNPSTPPLTLAQLAHNLSVSSRGAAIFLVPQQSNSLNARFLPRPSIKTLAVLVCDDDVEVDSKSVEFAFRMWRWNPERLIGIFVRSHDIDMTRKEWIYTVHPDKYSIVLTKFMMMKSEYLFKYSCGGGAPMREMRRMVDQMRNCEDILMNFVVADETNAGPLMVGAERARDWGDPRNEDQDGADDVRSKLVREVGLSSRRAEHRKRRGNCITEFHRVLGRMPLRYSYAKLVSSVVRLNDVELHDDATLDAHFSKEYTYASNYSTTSWFKEQVLPAPILCTSPATPTRGIMCEPCDGKGWVLCDFCKGQKTNVKADNKRIYRRCPSCRAIGYLLCSKCKVFKCVSFPNSSDGEELTF